MPFSTTGNIGYDDTREWTFNEEVDSNETVLQILMLLVLNISNLVQSLEQNFSQEQPMRLSYAFDDLKNQGWFDPFKTADRAQLYLPCNDDYHAVWRELDQLDEDPHLYLFTFPSSEWQRDQLLEPFEIGWHGWDEKQRWTLHYQPELRTNVLQNPECAERYERFLSLAEQLNSTALHIGLEFARTLDECRTTSGLADRVMNGGLALTRFLHYLPGSANHAARAHRDRSGITVHWWESSPGLVFYRSTQDWYDAPHGVSPIVFAGKKLWMTTKGKTPALVHGVRDMREMSAQAQSHRYSIVSFVHWEPLSEQEIQFRSTHRELAASFPYDKRLR
jgi:hypothetical protein